MTDALESLRPSRCIGGEAVSKASGRKTGILRRLFTVVFEFRQTQADREMARLLTQSGGRLTDDLERRMMQRVTSSNWSVRR